MTNCDLKKQMFLYPPLLDILFKCFFLLKVEILNCLHLFLILENLMVNLFVTLDYWVKKNTDFFKAKLAFIYVNI